MHVYRSMDVVALCIIMDTLLLKKGAGRLSSVSECIHFFLFYNIITIIVYDIHIDDVTCM